MSTPYEDGPADSNGYDDPDDPELDPATGEPFDAPRLARGASVRIIGTSGTVGRVLFDDGVRVRLELNGARIRDYPRSHLEP